VFFSYSNLFEIQKEYLFDLVKKLSKPYLMRSFFRLYKSKFNLLEQIKKFVLIIYLFWFYSFDSVLKSNDPSDLNNLKNF
jgi:hypothetical protein